jgi:hypothetical protein
MFRNSLGGPKGIPPPQFGQCTSNKGSPGFPSRTNQRTHKFPTMRAITLDTPGGKGKRNENEDNAETKELMLTQIRRFG